MKARETTNETTEDAGDEKQRFFLKTLDSAIIETVLAEAVQGRKGLLVVSRYRVRDLLKALGALTPLPTFTWIPTQNLLMFPDNSRVTFIASDDDERWSGLKADFIVTDVEDAARQNSMKLCLRT